MKILLVHNRYQQRGGEDAVFDSELALLRSRGFEVESLVFDNDAIETPRTFIRAAGLGLATVWSREGHRRVEEAVGRVRPDVVHFHNTFHLISPSGYYAAKRSGARVVQTLHNFRILCAAAILNRDGKPCEECVGKPVALPALRHACFRGSRGATAALVAMQATHRALGTWTRQVDAFIALTEFARGRFVAGGLPVGKLHVKPNFLESDPGVGSDRDGSVLFVGRLVPEKGVRTLLRAWGESAGLPKLTVIGDGPLAAEVRAAVGRGIEWLGWRAPEEVLERMKRASALVLPSTWYEGFPRTLVEAYAAGLPVIASDLGSLSELVVEGQTGLKVAPEDPLALGNAVRRVVQEDGLSARLSQGARSAFLSRFTADRHLESLLAIYRGEPPAGASLPRS